MHQRHPAAFSVVDCRSSGEKLGSDFQKTQQFSMAPGHGVRRQQSAIIGEDNRFSGDAESLIAPHGPVGHGPPMRRAIGLGIAVVDQLDLQIHG
ncbi:hypothetical protein D3C86_1403410 [compost metagenome]